MTGWKNDPRPHWYVSQQVPILGFGEFDSGVRETGSVEMCEICHCDIETHTDPIPPEVQQQQAADDGLTRRMF